MAANGTLSVDSLFSRSFVDKLAKSFGLRTEGLIFWSQSLFDNVNESYSTSAGLRVLVFHSCIFVLKAPCPKP